jgi:hypothetical protein
MNIIDYRKSVMIELLDDLRRSIVIFGVTPFCHPSFGFVQMGITKRETCPYIGDVKHD